MHSSTDSRALARKTLRDTYKQIEALAADVSDDEPDDAPTIFFLPFFFNKAGGFYALGPIDIESFNHPFRIICTYSASGGECWVSRRGVDCKVMAQGSTKTWSRLADGIAWLTRGPAPPP